MGTRRLADSYGGYRARLVDTLRDLGVEDLAILRAFGEIPRHRFVPDAFLRQAYEDTSLPIGNGQTISQPSTQARYLLALRLTGRERVLEIGTGSGYQAALLSLLARDVVTIERIPQLAKRARATLDQLEVENVRVITADGSIGWREGAPYEAILVAAASPTVPAPLVEQLSPDGRLILPIERPGGQVLTRVTRHRDGATEYGALGGAQFVPLIGQHGHRPGTTS